jgi:hypothetical protein
MTTGPPAPTIELTGWNARKGPWNSNGGWEYVLVLSTVALGLTFNGAGKLSLDHAIGWGVSGFWWGVGAAVVALIGAAVVLAAHAASRRVPVVLSARRIRQRTLARR